MSYEVLNSNKISPNILPAKTTYIAVGSEWEVDLIIGQDGTRNEVMDKYDLELANDPEKLRKIDELQNQNLLCFCAPRRCHGDTLIKLAAMSYEERLGWAEDIKARNQE